MSACKARNDGGVVVTDLVQDVREERDDSKVLGELRIFLQDASKGLCKLRGKEAIRYTVTIQT